MTLQTQLQTRLNEIVEQITEKIAIVWWGKYASNELNNIFYFDDKVIKFAKTHLGCVNPQFVSLQNEIGNFSDHMGTQFLTIKSPITNIC